MYFYRRITDDMYWVGGNDRRLEFFENIFPLSKGVTYNSYMIMDEKTALIDTVDNAIGRQFLENIRAVLSGRDLDYIVINHMEPDHCGLIEDLILRYPGVKIVGNAKTFPLIRQFYDFPIDDRLVTVKEKDTLSLGRHTLRFMMAPMVHWPEVMMTYDETDRVLYSADAFGSFGAISGSLFNDEVDVEKDWMDEYRRYYTNIVGKYGLQVQNALKKAAALDVQYICPLHGLVWRSDLAQIIGKYNLWSRYEAEEKGVMIAVASMYGNTENMADVFAGMLADRGVTNIRIHNISKTHVSELIADTFRYSHVVIAAPTYNNGIYPPMDNYLEDMHALSIQNKIFAVLGNGSWAPQSTKLMEEKLASLKNSTVLTEDLTIRSSLKEDQLPALTALADRIAADIAG